MTSANEDVGTKNAPNKQDPNARMRRLIELSHDISIERDIPISKYFNSGRGLIKTAAGLEEAGDIEKSFVLYLRYITLFLEKLIHHPEYPKADKAEKLAVRNECNRVFDIAEKLKQQIKEKYEKEHSESVTNIIAQESEIQAKDVQKIGSARSCVLDEIDIKYDFSRGAEDVQDPKPFDPFNIEELTDCLNNKKTI